MPWCNTLNEMNTWYGSTSVFKEFANRQDKQLMREKIICSCTDEEEIRKENNWLAQCHKDLRCQAGHLACIFQFLTSCTESIKIRYKILTFSLDKGFWGKDLRVRDIYIYFALAKIKTEDTRQWTVRFFKYHIAAVTCRETDSQSIKTTLMVKFLYSLVGLKLTCDYGNQSRKKMLSSNSKVTILW